MVRTSYAGRAWVTDHAERFRSRCVERENGCVEWSGSRSDAGYGVAWNGRRIYAHRFAWEIAHGSIAPEALVLHSCDNPACVNVAHLFLGSHADNSHDKCAKGRARNRYSGRDTCQRGHPWTPENTKALAAGRSCIACRRERERGRVRDRTEYMREWEASHAVERRAYRRKNREAANA